MDSAVGEMAVAYFGGVLLGWQRITLPCEAREEGGGGHEAWQEGRMRFFLIQPRSLVSSTFCGLGVSCYLLPRRCTLSGR